MLSTIHRNYSQILLWGSASWCIKHHHLNQLRSFHRYCIRELCFQNMKTVQDKRITANQLHITTSIPLIENIVRSRQLRFLSRIANGNDDTLLRMLITSQCWKNTANPAAKYSTKKTTRKAWKDALIAARLFDVNQKITNENWINCLRHDAHTN